MNEGKTSYNSVENLDSAVTRSIAAGGLAGRPQDGLAPLIACIDERSSEKDSRQRSQHKVLL